jgi:hypothetical protein
MGYPPVKQRGVTYYVSQSGTGAGLSSLDPMSVSSLISALPTIPQNSTVYLNRGDTFDMQIDLVKSFISFNAYGTGALPIIRGSVDISSQTWVNDGTGQNVFYTVMGVVPKTIFVGGVECRKSETAAITVTSRAASTTVTASTATLNALNTVESIIGAEYVGQLLGWHPTFAHTVTGYSTGILTFASKVGTVINVTNSGGYNLYPNVGRTFKLKNKRSFISAVNDWSYDSSTQRLYIKTSGSAPTNIRACTKDYGIDIAEYLTDVSISNIEFTQQYLEGIRSTNNKDVTINLCTAHDIHLNGITARKGGDNIYIINSTIYNISNTGINIGRVTNSLIRSNVIHDIGNQSWICPEHYSYAIRDFYTGGAEVDQILTLGTGIGIHCGYDVETYESVPDVLTIEKNTVYSLGYSAIAFVGKNITVQKNLIYDYCQVWQDGGGIYCIGRPFGQSCDTTNCLISYNIVRDTTGSGELEGIYIDNGCTLITVDNNTVKGITQFGILVNWDSYQITVTNNKVVGPANANTLIIFRNYNQWVGFQGVKARFGNSSSNTCTGNIMVSKYATGPCMGVYSGDGNTSFNPFTGGSLNNNHYVNPYSANIGNFDAGAPTNYTFAGWKTKWGADAASTSYTNYIAYSNAANADIEVMIEFNPTDSAVSFVVPVGYTDVYGNAPSNPVTINTWSSYIYLKTTAA